MTIRTPDSALRSAGRAQLLRLLLPPNPSIGSPCGEPSADARRGGFPRVRHVTVAAYTRRIYDRTVRMILGFESFGPLAPVWPPSICGCCSSGRSFAYRFLQIRRCQRHPCGSASGSHHQGPQRTFTSKSNGSPPQRADPRLAAQRAMPGTPKKRPFKRRGERMRLLSTQIRQIDGVALA